MTKKEMAARIAELEKQNSELVAALVALANQKGVQYVYIPAQPIVPAPIPYTPAGPYYHPYNEPIITCGVNVTSKDDRTQIFN